MANVKFCYKLFMVNGYKPTLTKDFLKSINWRPTLLNLAFRELN